MYVEFESKSREYDSLLYKVETSNFMEMNSYINILEKTNKELNRKLEMVIYDQETFTVSN